MNLHLLQLLQNIKDSPVVTRVMSFLGVDKLSFSV